VSTTPERQRFNSMMHMRRELVVTSDRRCSKCGRRGHRRNTCGEPRLRDDPPDAPDEAEQIARALERRPHRKRFKCDEAP